MLKKDANNQLFGRNFFQVQQDAFHFHFRSEDVNSYKNRLKIYHVVQSEMKNQHFFLQVAPKKQ